MDTEPARDLRIGDAFGMQPGDLRGMDAHSRFAPLVLALGFGRRRRQPLTSSALRRVLGRMGRGDLTAHGFRSSFRDWAAERTNFPAEVAKMALAHVVGDKVEAAYRRGDLFQKRRQLAEAWARFCSMPAASGKVVAIRATV